MSIRSSITRLVSSTSKGAWLPESRASEESSPGSKKSTHAWKVRKENPKRAAPLLHKIHYFADLESDIPGLIEKVSEIAEFVHLPEGEVLFRQGDPPENVYYIVEGEVSIYARGDDAPPTPKFEDYEEEGEEGRRCFCLREPAKTTVKTVALQMYDTFEGFSKFCHASSFGNLKVTLGPGSCFADQALTSDDPRNATVQCSKTCEFMIVHRERFDLRLYEKVCFFRDLPGFSDYKATADPNKHPANIFQKQTCSRDQVLLFEGQVMRRALYVIKSGSIAFCRTARSKVGLSKDETSRCWSIMGARSIFCSVSMLGVFVSEPCSAIVISDKCVLFKIVDESIDEFAKKSPEVMHAMIEAIEYGMKRVLLLSSSFAGCRFAARPPMDEPPVFVVDVEDL